LRALSYGKKRAEMRKRALRTTNLLELFIFMLEGVDNSSGREVGFPVTILDSSQQLESFLYLLSYNSLS